MGALVVLSAFDIKLLDQDSRRRIVEYVLAKGVRSRDLGVSSSLINMVKLGVRDVSDQLVASALHYISVDEFIALTGGVRDHVVISRGRPLSEVDKSVLAEIVVRDPELRAFIRSLLRDVEGRDFEERHRYRVSSRDLERFRSLISDRSRRTVSDRMRYLRLAMADLGWELSPERVRRYVLDLQGRRPHIAVHVSKALKLFVKLVVRDRELYDSIPNPRVGAALYKDPPRLEEVKAIAAEIDDLASRVFYAMLAETGLRPGELYGAKISWLDLDLCAVVPARDPSSLRASKRAYISMFSRRLCSVVSSEYMAFRRRIRRGSGDKLFPFKERSLRLHIYSAMDRALGRRFRLYDLKSFFATYMISRGVLPLIVSI